LKNPFENLEKLKEVITTQVTYDLIPFRYGAFSFKGAEKKTLVPLVLSIPYASLPSKRSEFEYFFSLNLTVNVSNSLGQVVFEASKDINFKKTATEMAGLLNASFRFPTSFSLEPGDYRLHLLVLDNTSGKVGTSHQPLSIPDLSAEGPAMSDIILSTEGVPSKGLPEGEEEGLAAAVLGADTERVFRVGDEMSVFFEVYGLSLNQATGLNKVKTEYAFLQSGKTLARIAGPPIEPSAQRDCRIRTSFRLKNFEPGEYVLRAAVTDENSGQGVSRDIRFTISNGASHRANAGVEEVKR